MENIQKLKNAGDYKSLYNLLDQLIKSNPGNAALYYEMGLTLKNMNRPKEGINYIQFSMAYDCEVWRGGEIYNVIAKRVAESNEVFYYDFSQMLKDQWGKNELYYDELYPQNLYYEQTMTSLGEVLKQTLKI
jgi:tetratricopeptide (TPR) repeat protein